MSKLPILILHGWSGVSEHLKPLSNFLKKSGFNVVDIWLADYISMNDEITIQDLGQAMGTALKSNKIPEKPHSFDVIVHSTGGLVIRQYLLHYFLGRPQDCPIKRLVMLAPAHFGSPLAHIGKSMIGRIRLGWDWGHLFQTGTRILDALELGSPISWQLAEQDLFNPDNAIFKPQNLFTTILVGTDAYSGMAGSFHENGSDGTVRVSTANLNATYLKITFGYPKGLEIIEQKHCYDPIAFGVLYNHNHGTITRPDQENQLAERLIKGLSIESASEYNDHISTLAKVTDETFAKGIQDTTKEKRYHQYQHAVTRVHDQFGEGVEDYFLEFYQQRGDKEETVMQKIQSEILEKVRPYSRDSSYRSFFFDITDMKKQILEQGKQVDMSLCAAALSDRISYLNPNEYLPVVSDKDKTLLNPNTTLFVDIELPRIQSEKVFRFKKA
jgi:pimeloyl-ACP methyl ester carboxylesterase